MSEADSASLNDSDVNTDDLFDVLSNPRRRYILSHLQASKTPMALADLTDAVVRWETGEEPTAVQAVREQVYISLYHWHLPKLADAGLISFNRDRKLAGIHETADDLPHTVVRPSADEHPIESH
jgi:DNA-binding transcriptional ArsR family regulator